MKFKRVLLKLSGESLMGEQSYGIAPEMLIQYATDVKKIVERGVQVAIVMGGGNIFRGLKGAAHGINRIQGDYMGMLATIINCMALQAEFDKMGVPAEIFSGLDIDPICRKMSSRNADKLLKAHTVVIIAGGTGNPFFTTDTAAALRAAEIHADVLLKGTRVDGVYTADPEKDPNAVRYEKVTFDEVYEKNLNIMDLTAFTLCKENNIPIIVFNMNEPGNLEKVITGQNIGTIVDSL